MVGYALVMLLIVGLGNPGRDYAAHRHNVGFMVIDDLARRVSAEGFRDKLSGMWARAELAGEQATLVKPTTYMNGSGLAVHAAMAFFKVAPADLYVLHDDLDIPFGEVRLKVGGGHAGHRGVRSIMEQVGTGDFGRIRIGIGRPPPEHRGEVTDFVLSGFGAGEQAGLAEVIEKAGDAVLDIARRGFTAAMNTRNARPKPKRPPKPELSTHRRVRTKHICVEIGQHRTGACPTSTGPPPRTKT